MLSKDQLFVHPVTFDLRFFVRLKSAAISIRSITVDNLDAIGAGLAALAIYCLSLPPDVGWWDIAEAQTVPFVAGIFHAPGFPAYVLAGWLFSHSIEGSVAWRLNLFSALCTAASVSLAVLAGRGLGASRVSAVLAALFYATASNVWRNGTRAESETLELFFLSAAICSGLSGALILPALCCGLAIGAHLSAAWFIPAVLTIALTRPVQRERSALRLVLAVCALLVGISTYLYLPIRAGELAPRTAMWNASLPVHEGIWYTHDIEMPGGFLRYISGTEYGAPSSLFSIFDLRNYPGFISAFAKDFAREFGLFGIVLALIAILLKWRCLAVRLLCLTAFSIYPFALSYRALDQPPKYYLTSYWTGAVLIALGLTSVARLGRGPMARITRVVATALFASAITLTLSSSGYWSQRADRSAASIVWSVIRKTPDDAVIASEWTYATPLFYAAYVTHQLGHRKVIAERDHATLTEIARHRPLYYFPLPADDVHFESARLRKIDGSSPDLYRVEPNKPGAERKLSAAVEVAGSRGALRPTGTSFYAIPKSRRTYPLIYAQKLVEVVRAGRRPDEVAHEFESSPQRIAIGSRKPIVMAIAQQPLDDRRARRARETAMREQAAAARASDLGKKQHPRSMKKTDRGPIWRSRL